MTYREIVYMCLDTLKITSDDSIFNEDHILFLINRYRSILLQQKYSDIRNQVLSSKNQILLHIIRIIINIIIHKIKRFLCMIKIKTLF